MIFRILCFFAMVIFICCLALAALTLDTPGASWFFIKSGFWVGGAVVAIGALLQLPFSIGR